MEERKTMERLQKVIAHAGVASRRKAEQLIIDGKVKVNGQIVTTLGIKVNATDEVSVNDVPIYQEEPVYYMFYKPRGVITAVEDDKGRAVVTDYFTDVTQRIYPVGRLDYDTSGLLLLTNDGQFAQRLTHPKHEVEKTYVAKVKGLADSKRLYPLTKGLRYEKVTYAPARYEILSTNQSNGTSIVKLMIHEGKNHQVKNMFKALDLPVMKLKREGYGDLTLGNLRPGQYRTLTNKEVKHLLHLSK